MIQEIYIKPAVQKQMAKSLTNWKHLAASDKAFLIQQIYIQYVNTIWYKLLH